MMTIHAVVLPILLPMLAGALLLSLSKARLRWKRLISSLATLLLLPLTLWLALQADQGMTVYALGNWQPPFGIVLVVDRFSALLLVITAVLAVPAGLSMSYGLDRKGQNFHALFQFQLMGINGAFLTGDLFNLFVFFEILLIASYALLVHGLGRPRLAAGLHYVVINLLGSALFLIAAGLLYALTGTLNMADLGVKLAALPVTDLPLARAAGLLLLLVFALKAALLPIGMWLPSTYAVASAPIAALFAVMTKVGVYAIVRVHGLWFGEGALAGLGRELIGGLALLTLLFGAIGALGARRLQQLLAWMAVVSVGTLLSAWSFASEAAYTAMLYYLIHSTWVAAALFLICGVIAQQRGEQGDALVSGPRPQGTWLAISFMVAAVALVGLPPLSGFVGKVLLLQAAGTGSWAVWFWVLLIGSGAVGLVAFSRAGSSLFWRSAEPAIAPGNERRQPFAPVLLLLPLSILMAIFAEPLLYYLQAAASELRNPSLYINAVLGSQKGGQG